MSIQIDRKQIPSAHVFVLKGRMVSDEGLQEILDSLEHLPQECRVICDLSGLEYCNSTGLNFFIRILTRVRKTGGDCILVGMQPGVKKLFEISKLIEIFNCVPTLDEAVTNI